MPTGQQIVTSALTLLGINGQGETPSASDSQFGLDQLNAMWESWSIDEGLIYAVQSQQFNLTINVPSYAIGAAASAPFNVPMPTRIFKAFYVTSNGRNEIEIVNGDKYFAHNDLLASAVAPDELYPDYNPAVATGLATLYLWPVPSLAGAKLELMSGAAFNTWALGTNYHLPYSYQDALQWALAYRLLSSFGAVVAPEVAQNVMQVGAKAQDRLREMNSKNRQEPTPMVLDPAQQLQPPQAQK